MKKFIFFVSIFVYIFVVVFVSFSFENQAIIGGECIGPVKIGMNSEEVQKANIDSMCSVEAIYIENKAVELRTNWGGSCATPEGIMASTYNAGFILSLMGDPAEVKNSSEPHAVGAVWWIYHKKGIGFYILYFEDGSIVQTISVFKKTLN